MTCMRLEMLLSSCLVRKKVEKSRPWEDKVKFHPRLQVVLAVEADSEEVAVAAAVSEEEPGAVDSVEVTTSEAVEEEAETT